MNIAERFVGSVLILDLNGRMTAQDGCGGLRERVKNVIHEGHIKLLLHLDQVSFIDSTCIGQIVSSYITAHRNGASFKLLKPTARITALLTLAKLTEVFEIYDAEPDGITSFSKPDSGAFTPRW